MASEDIKNQIIDALRDMIGGYMFQGGGSRSISSKQFGQNSMAMMAPYITGNPIMQQLISSVGGNIMGNVMSAQFPGARGGLNVNDSLIDIKMREARTTLMDKAREEARLGLKDVKSGNMAFNIASRMAGVQGIATGLDPTQFGYINMPFGNKGFVSAQQGKRNDAIRERLYGSGGLVRTMTADFAKNPYGFGGMNATDVGTLAGDMAARGQLSGDNSGSIAKIKEAAKSIKSIRDIIKGPLREVVMQMEQTFGSGYLNTFGSGGAAGMVNKMRAVAQMGGFTTQQIMSLAPSAQQMVTAVGGARENAVEAASMTGILMGLSRGKNKRFVDDGHLTSVTMKAVVGAQQSKMGLNVASARSMLETDEQKAKFDNMVRERMTKGDISVTELSKITEDAGHRINAGNIIGNRNTLQTKTEMQRSDIGTEAALLSQQRGEANLRRRKFIAVLGKDKYDAMVADADGDANAVLFGDLQNMGLDSVQSSRIARSFSRRSRRMGHANYMETNRVYGDIREGIKRNKFSKRLGVLYEKSHFGSDLGTNILGAMGKGGNLKETLKKLLNADENGVIGNELLKKSGMDQDDVEEAMLTLKADADALKLGKKETAAYITEHGTNLLLHKKGFEGYKETYEKRRKASMNDLSRGIGEIFENKLEDQLTEKEKQVKKETGRSMTASEKQTFRRKKQIEQIKAQLSGQILNEKDQTKKDRLTEIRDKIAKADPNYVDDIIKKNSKELGDAYSGRLMSKLGGTEVTGMTKLVDMVLVTLPEIAKFLKTIAALIANPADKILPPWANTVLKTVGLKK